MGVTLAPHQLQNNISIMKHSQYRCDRCGRIITVPKDVIDDFNTASIYCPGCYVKRQRIANENKPKIWNDNNINIKQIRSITTGY
jgi:DNA-directed RNA polymerase subunit RPC12/RpoP